MELIKELVLVIARALVDEPDQVNANVIEGAHSSIIELSVSKNDIGKIIGKQGRTVDAFRTVLRAVGAKARNRVTIEVIE